MFTIEDTQDPDLVARGLHRKVVEHLFDGTTRVVGYFSDPVMAAMVRDALNESACIATVGEVS